MTFDNDEPIVATRPDASGGKSSQIFEIVGKTKVEIINKPEAPLVESKFNVMLEMTGAGLGKERPGLDLVMVLDVSGSMGEGEGEKKGEKLRKMKQAVHFVMKKLSTIDRLSVVKFNLDSQNLCPLRQINNQSQGEISDKVDALVANGGTNIAAGLQTGLQIINDRRLKSGRTSAIMLMSDGVPSPGTPDAAMVQVGDVRVHTFGFGEDQDPRVLDAIAKNSIGGTFSNVSKTDDLNKAFSQCLAGLLTVAVQDLKLTVAPAEDSMVVIQYVSAGDYPQSRDNDAGSVTVSFGDLYDKETRRVMVDLLLPAVESRQTGVDVLEVTYTYSAKEKLFDGPPLFATINRTGAAGKQEREEVMIEENRLRTARMIKEARVIADDKKLDDAQDKLVEAENMLEDVLVDEPNPMIETLKSELQQLLKLMKSQDIYEKQGRAFALSSETSHDRQRFAARGNDVEKLRLFATPRMDAYLEQAKSFDEDPSKPLPTEDDDVKKEIAADPLAPIVGALSYYLQTAIQSLQSIDKILNNATRST